MNNYWIDRVNKQNAFNYARDAAAADKKLAALYKKTANNLVLSISDLHNSLIKTDGTISINDLYKNNKYFLLLTQINKELNDLGYEEVLVTESKLLDMYNITQAAVSSEMAFTIDNAAAAQNIIDSVWCKDGKHWSNRIWNNKKQMQATLESGLVDCVSRGLPKDELVKAMKMICNTDFNKADRLVRTELTYVQNKAAADSYTAAGCKYYKYLATDDDRVSDTCYELDGEVFSFDDAAIGVNFPPMHANCRCTILPVIED